MTPSAPVSALRGALVLEPVGENAWRICDGRVRAGEGRFIAFVEQKGDEFEVMQLAEDFIWTTFRTLDAAIDHVVDSDWAQSRSAGNLSWIR